MPNLLSSNSLEINIAGIKFNSPLLNASGAFNPDFFSRLFPLDTTLGAILSKTVTPLPQAGNPQQRTVELPGIGMLNSIGLQNPGLAYFLETEAPIFQTHGLPIILSISAHSQDAFGEMARQIESHPNGQYVQLIEVNLSCPNVEKGGAHFGTIPSFVVDAISAVTENTQKPVFAKLTPNVTDILSLADAAIQGGASGLTAINTVMGCSIDIKTRKPILPRVSGGYSGPGIKPIALHAVWQLYKSFPNVPIMAVGGMEKTEDILEFIFAGASLTQVGTACFRSPLVFTTIIQELRHYLK
ncbi:MAG: dihydroorotate dehydrogenase, partial [Cyanobacteria bacterium]|nr:dihydroorotate dehydrogenase [Cyanobacteriota bacterium]